MKHTAVIITVSDRSAAGERIDLSGPEAASMLDVETFSLIRSEIIPDDYDRIRALLASCVAEDVALVLTVGGTGFAPRDITPEATLKVIDRRADSLSEAMRSASLARTRFAMLSRGVCGIAGRTLIVNLPGAPAAVRECLDVILPVIPHALKLMREESVADRDHAEGRRASAAMPRG